MFPRLGFPQRVAGLSLFVLVPSLFAAVPRVHGEQRAVPLTAESWKASGSVAWPQGSGVEIGSGIAVLQEMPLEHATVDFEMQLSGLRSFAYLQFRRTAADTGVGDGLEEIYFRAHKSLAPDALQYTPAYAGGGNWQVFHGASGTAPVALPAAQWIPVRVRFAERTLEVFVGAPGEPIPADAAPDLRVWLQRAPRSGAIGLRGFVPRGSQAPYAMRVRNLRVDSQRPRLEAAAEPPEDSAAIKRFRLSRVVSLPPDAPAVLGEFPPGLDGDQPGGGVVEARPDGLLLLFAHRTPAEDARRWAAVAEVSIVSAAPVRRRLELGYSDSVTVWLNGEPLFAADDSYSYDLPRRQGLVSTDQATIFLPLRKGENTLRFLVSDRFGGWALQARLPERDGLQILP